MSEETGNPTNSLAILSLVFAILTFVSFCIGWMPFLVGSSIICYPAALFFGALAFITGIIARRQIRASGHAGNGFALTGVWLGGLTTLLTICATILTISAVAAFVIGWLNDYFKAQ